MKKWISLILLAIVLALPNPGIVVGQGDELTLVPFTDESFGIQGVVPDGWQEIAPGVYARGNGPTDVVLVAEQATPSTADATLTALLPQLGLTAAPESVGTLDTDTLSWTLYRVDVPSPALTISVDLALAEADGKTYIVVMQVGSDEYDALHEAVFLPVLQALAPYAPEPVEVPYVVEDVTFANGDITLAGTLTMPDVTGPHPVVILVTGSGPQDRDESLAPVADIKPFALIADHLTRNGIAVLRYDDRGVGESIGEVDGTIADYATDTAAAIDYLLTRPEIDPNQIGILGHSQGGIIAAMLGAQNSHVAFIIGMAGPAVNGRDLLLVQNERLLVAEGATETQVAEQLAFVSEFFDQLESGADEATIYQLVADHTRAQIEALSDDQKEALGDIDSYVQQSTDAFMGQYNSQWFLSFLQSDPGPDWAQVTVPVLGLFGGNDVQVDATQNATALEEILTTAGNSDFQIVTLPDANHLFQAAQTGAVSEYGVLEQEFTPDFLPTLTDWLLAHLTLATQ
ncbi:MAG: alpha/beta fold hydrolase [Chloroflexi bacterium]|nr:alpha/beta fold hydrolase [Chloroflexota bacterium]